jgi:hypothetical protein
MFGLFKKQIHEAVDLQRQDVLKCCPESRATLILNGEDCDQITGGYGPFGGLTNPIPVNGPIGEIKYLGKLRGKAGAALFFHRIFSCASPASKNPIDEYEVVCLDGTQWNSLHFEMHHPRHSKLAPPGYTLMPCDKVLKEDIPFAFSINGRLENFPFGLPNAIDKFYGGNGILARHAREWLGKGNFSRP